MSAEGVGLSGGGGGSSSEGRAAASACNATPDPPAVLESEAGRPTRAPRSDEPLSGASVPVPLKTAPLQLEEVKELLIVCVVWYLPAFSEHTFFRQGGVELAVAAAVSLRWSQNASASGDCKPAQDIHQTRYDEVPKHT